MLINYPHLWTFNVFKKIIAIYNYNIPSNLLRNILDIHTRECMKIHDAAIQYILQPICDNIRKLPIKKQQLFFNSNPCFATCRIILAKSDCSRQHVLANCYLAHQAPDILTYAFAMRDYHLCEIILQMISFEDRNIIFNRCANYLCSRNVQNHAVYVDFIKYVIKNYSHAYTYIDRSGNAHDLISRTKMLGLPMSKKLNRLVCYNVGAISCNNLRAEQIPDNMAKNTGLYRIVCGKIIFDHDKCIRMYPKMWMHMNRYKHTQKIKQYEETINKQYAELLAQLDSCLMGIIFEYLAYDLR